MKTTRMTSCRPFVGELVLMSWLQLIVKESLRYVCWKRRLFDGLDVTVN